MKPATARLRILLIAAAAVAVSAPAAHAETYFGKFIGKFVAEFDEEGGGRKVTLMEPYGFIDPYGKEWNVPTGYKTDGASVPAALWALYPPFTGNYRSAAVIHDYYCDNKDRSLAGHAQGLLFRHARRPCRRDHGQGHVQRRLSVRPALGPGHAARPAQRRRSRPRRSSRRKW